MLEETIHALIDGVVEVKQTYNVVFLEDITDLAVEMAKAAKGSTFKSKVLLILVRVLANT